MMKTLEVLNRPSAVSYLQATVDVLRNTVSMLKGENERLTKDIDVYVVELAEKDKIIENQRGWMQVQREQLKAAKDEIEQLYSAGGY